MPLPHPKTSTKSVFAVFSDCLLPASLMFAPFAPHPLQAKNRPKNPRSDVAAGEGQSTLFCLSAVGTDRFLQVISPNVHADPSVTRFHARA